MKNDRLLPNVLCLAAVAGAVVATYGVAGLFVALFVASVLLAGIGYILAQQEAPAPDTGPDAVEKALAAAQKRHDLELAGVVSQAEERGREEIRRAVEAERRADQDLESLKAGLK